ncbi:MAG: hypothetical protein ACKOWF_02170 [Chloroflexota bacterium]
MNVNEPIGREGGPTRRSLLVTAGGLLLPAGLLVAGDAGDAGASRKRRRRPGMVGLFANDTIINVRNGTGAMIMFQFSSSKASVGLAPGKETGFSSQMKPDELDLDATVDIVVNRGNANETSYRLTARNFNIGTPDAEVVRRKLRRDGQMLVWDEFEVSGRRNMDEGDTFDATDGGFRFHVHRWSNGKEPLDDYKEWYTRFFLTVANA